VGVVDERERDREQEQHAEGPEAIGVLHAPKAKRLALGADDSKPAVIAQPVADAASRLRPLSLGRDRAEWLVTGRRSRLLASL
jgi:hypothetical protein